MGEEKQNSIETSFGVFGKEACVELPAEGLADTADHTGMVKYQASEEAPEICSLAGEKWSPFPFYTCLCISMKATLSMEAFLKVFFSHHYTPTA